MGNSDEFLHILMIPFMAPGHQIPMFDLAKVLLSKDNVKLSIATTTHNMVRFCAQLNLNGASTQHINLHVLDFQPEAYGLPSGAENFDSIGRDMIGKFLNAVMHLEPQADEIVRKHRPDAIISDLFMPWTDDIARKYGIPRVGLQVSSCFAKVVTDGVMRLLFGDRGGGGSGTKMTNYEERFLVPGLPDEVYVTMDQTPSRFFKDMEATEFLMKAVQAEMNTTYIIYNTFREMEHLYLDFYERNCGKKVWSLGPLLLYNKDEEDITDRGKASNFGRDECISWLDLQKAQSVIYVAFGSISIINEAQLLEIGLGLEASNVPFIWAVREVNKIGPEIAALEERVKGRGLIIKGWAPQAIILDHPSTGGFLTHCGWNSTLEGICLGKPMLTWPIFGEQFYTQTFVSERLKTGFGIGVDTGMEWGTEEELGAQVKQDQVARQVIRLMKGDETPEIRKRAKELSELAKEAVREGGSSSRNLDGFIGELLDLKAKREKNIN